MLRFLILAISFSFLCLNANDFAIKIKQKTDFLDSIKEELQKEDKDDSQKNKQIIDCLECVESVRARLDLIKSELIKSKKNTALINELIEEFNNKMKDLKDKYEFLKLSDNETSNDIVLDDSSVSVSAITYLNPISKKKFIKKSQEFSEIEFEPINAEELTSSNPHTSCKENHMFPKD